MRLSILSGLAAVSTLAGAAQAQGDFLFQIDSNATGFTWSGTTSLGDIDEQPPNFTLSGTVLMTMDGGGNPVGAGAFAGGGDALITPNIHGEIPNVFPFLPPLATIDMANVHVRVSSPSFAVDAAGNFSTLVTVHILSGTLTIDDISGGHVVTDLAGNSSNPEAASGTITWSGTQYTLTSPVSSNFAFADPTSGVSGSVTLNGTIVARHLPVPPAVYCTSNSNSTGAAAQMTPSGSPSLFEADLNLGVSLLPHNVFGLYFYGPNQATIPFGNGVRCVDGSLKRFPVVSTGPLGSVNQWISNATLPASGPVSVGDTRNFQFWFRDVAGGGAAFNTSSAVSVLFTP
jgi:hypothetical protein